MNQISHLYQLQVTDTEIRVIQNRLDEIEKILLSDKTVQKAEILLKEKENNYENKNKELKRIEGSVKSIEEKIKNNENSLYGGFVKNPKELQDLQSENSALKRRVASIEEDQLSVMIDLEKAEQDRNLAKEKLIEVQSTFATRQASLLGEKDQLQKKLEKAATERKVIASAIGQEIMAKYESLLKKKNYLAVVKIIDDSCPACGTTVRPYEYQAARSPNQMTFCSTCGRILYAV